MRGNRTLSVGLMTPTLFTTEPCGMDRLREAAVIADDSPVDVLWVGDHLLWHVPILDPMIALGALAALTRRVTLGTNVLQLPLRPPVVVAKAFATLSYLTSGRVLVGVGVGGEYEPEWRAAGVDPQERGRRANESLRMLRRLWAGETDDGRFYSAPGVPLEPGPVRRVPIWVGGRSDAAYRRAASEDGYLGYMLTAARFAEARDKILEAGRAGNEFAFGYQFMTRIGDTRETALSKAVESLARTYHRDPAPFEKYAAAGRPEDVAGFVQQYVDRGLTHASFYLHGPHWPEQAQQLIDEVLPLLGLGDEASPGTRERASASTADSPLDTRRDQR
jgi:alkanesulfonate monooxygenase SsuD/methylene tetrahydromethanopterin reductase-like flavin-dependent oxidoreductase (luciferase family)